MGPPRPVRADHSQQQAQMAGDEDGHVEEAEAARPSTPDDVVGEGDGSGARGRP